MTTTFAEFADVMADPRVQQAAAKLDRVKAALADFDAQQQPPPIDAAELARRIADGDLGALEEVQAKQRLNTQRRQLLVTAIKLAAEDVDAARREVAREASQQVRPEYSERVRAVCDAMLALWQALAAEQQLRQGLQYAGLLDCGQLQPAIPPKRLSYDDWTTQRPPSMVVSFISEAVQAGHVAEEVLTEWTA
jgi:hypothetical protein